MNSLPSQIPGRLAVIIKDSRNQNETETYEI
jgi:hypothetical protein